MSLTGCKRDPPGSQSGAVPFSPKTAAKSMGGSGVAGVCVGSTQAVRTSSSGRSREVEKRASAQGVDSVRVGGSLSGRSHQERTRQV